MSKTRRRLRRFAIAALLLLATSLIVFGPWPADNRPFVDSDYQAATLAALDDADVWTTQGKLRVGIAQVDFTPHLRTPLAGFGARDPMAAEGIDTRTFARALTLQVNDRLVTILTADLLMIDNPLADAVLQRANLKPGDIYFTASHTHSGRGGWSKGIIEEQIIGRYHDNLFIQTANGLADAVKQSREQLTDATFTHTVTQVNNLLQNRIDKSLLINNRLHALIFRDAKAADQPPLAILLVFSAHANVLGSGNNDISADYPGHLVDSIKAKTNANHVLFAAGAVGDLRPTKLRGKTQSIRAENYGQDLADALDITTQPPPTTAVTLGNARVDVTLPGFRVPIGSDWRLSPVCSSWVADEHTHIHALRVGNILLAGFPGDYSGHLVEPLREALHDEDLTLIATSFNGSYKGYFVTADVYNQFDTYATRSMNFFGPWAGEHLNDIALRRTTHQAR